MKKSKLIILPCLGLLASNLTAATYAWNSVSGGSLNSGTNWTPVVTNPALEFTDADTLSFSQDFAAIQTFTLDGNLTVGTITYDDTGAAPDVAAIISAGSGGTLTLGGATPTVTVSTVLASPGVTISANLAGTSGLTKTGPGGLTLSGDNSALIGTLTIGDGGTTPAANNTAGVYISSLASLGGITTVTTLGTGSTGGFFRLAGTGITVPNTVTFNLSGIGGNSAPNGTLVSSGTGVNVVQGTINVNSGVVRISNAGATRLDVEGPILFGTNAIFFRLAQNEGVHLINTGNSGTGKLTHGGGILWFEPGALPTTALDMVGSDPGTLQTSGSFTRALGTAVGQVNWVQANSQTALREGGFSARGGDLTVNLGGAGAAQTFFNAFSVTGTRTATSTSITPIDTTNLVVGMNVSGTGIPNNATISAIPTPGVAGTITLSAAASAAGTTALTFTQYNAGRINTNGLWLNNPTADSKLTFVNPLVLNGFNRSIRVDANTAEITGVISGATGIEKVGAGTLVLSATNTFTGPALIAGGTLRMAPGALVSGIAGGFTGSGTLDIEANNLTFSTFNASHITTVAAFTTANTSAAVTGTGTLTVNGAANLEWGPGGSLTTNPNVAINLSGLSNFVYNAPANTFRVGLKGGTANTAALAQVATATLAQNNTLTAVTVAVGDVGASNDGGVSTLNLGTSNLIKTGTVNVGYSGRSDANLSFASGLTNATATIRGLDGISALPTWNVGRVGQFSSAAQTTFSANVDLTGGTVDALVTNLVVGVADPINQTARLGTQNSTFTLGAGTLTAGTVVVGRISGATGTVGGTFTANGTFTLAQAAGTLAATTINLAENTIVDAGGTRSVSGTFNLNAGTLKAQTIQKGAQTGPVDTAVTATFNWNEGTIRNLDASTDLSIPSGFTAFSLLGAGVHTLMIDSGRQGTIAQALSDTGALTKAGDGVLSLSGSSTYSGGTTVSAGTVILGSATALGTGPATVNAGGKLDLGGQVITNSVTLSTGGSISGTGSLFANGNSVAGIVAPGNSAGTVNFTNGSLTLDATAVASLEIGGTTPGSFDVITANGPITLAAGSVVNVVFINGFTPVAGNTWDLFADDGGLTSAATLNLPSLPPGLAWNTANFSNAITGGQISIVSTDPVAAYAGTFGLSGNNALPGADPDGDGISNALEYALGISPTANNGPEYRGIASTSSGALTLSYRRPLNGVPGVAYGVEFKTADLVVGNTGWSTGVLNTDYTQSVTPNGDGTTETVVISLTGTVSGKKFARVAVTY